jgi:hypothetical protein
LGRSVINMCPGLCVIMSGGFEASATACGVTPQAQNTGTSPGAISCGSPHWGFVMSWMPMAVGSPMWIGARGADVGHLDDGARTWIALTEEQEIIGLIFGKNGEIGLNVVLAESRGDSAKPAVANVPNLPRMSRVDEHVANFASR